MPAVSTVALVAGSVLGGMVLSGAMSPDMPATPAVTPPTPEPVTAMPDPGAKAKSKARQDAALRLARSGAMTRASTILTGLGEAPEANKLG